MYNNVNMGEHDKVFVVIVKNCETLLQQR